MTTFSDLAAELEGYAEAEWTKVKTEAIVLEQEVEPVIESAFALLVKQFGQLAVSTVMNLMGAAGAAMSGGEKLNLTATTIKDAVIQSGTTVIDSDISALANNAYVAVMGKAPAAGETLVQEGLDVAEKAVGDITGS